MSVIYNPLEAAPMEPSPDAFIAKLYASLGYPLIDHTHKGAMPEPPPLVFDGFLVQAGPYDEHTLKLVITSLVHWIDATMAYNDALRNRVNELESRIAKLEQQQWKAQT